GARRAPELHDAGVELAAPAPDVVEVALRVRMDAVVAHEVWDGDEADGVAQVALDGGGVLEAAHRPGGRDAEAVAGLAVDGGGAVAVDVRVHVEDRDWRGAHTPGLVAVVEPEAVGRGRRGRAARGGRGFEIGSDGVVAAHIGGWYARGR